MCDAEIELKTQRVFSLDKWISLFLGLLRQRGVGRLKGGYYFFFFPEKRGGGFLLLGECGGGGVGLWEGVRE